MLRAVRRFFKYSLGRPKFSSPNLTLITNHQLASLFAVSPERLIVFDLRCATDIERFAYIIPGTLLTIRASVSDLAGWIPSEAIVVLYAADNIFAYAHVLAGLPPDAHFCLLENGLRSWRQAQFPLEPVNQRCIGNRIRRNPVTESGCHWRTV